jgi:hypothetical protein
MFEILLLCHAYLFIGLPQFQQTEGLLLKN